MHDSPSDLALKVNGSGRAWFWSLVNEETQDVLAQAPRPARSHDLAKQKARAFVQTLRGYSVKGVDD